MFALSKLRVIWTSACSTYILRKDYPFPSHSLDSLSDPELEHQTCRAFALASSWISGRPNTPRRIRFPESVFISSVSEVRFLPGHGGNRILTLSRGVWDALTIWDLRASPQKLCEWSPRGAIFNGMSLNSDPSSAAVVAISLLIDGNHSVEILSLGAGTDDVCYLQTLHSIQSELKPTGLHREILAISDDDDRTEIWNWRLGTSAVLRHPTDDNEGSWPHDKCIEVLPAHRSVLVVRAHSLHLFPEPELHLTPQTYAPIMRHSFGWIDSISVARTPTGSISMLLHGESDYPWASGLYNLDLYTLHPNLQDDESSPPYIFPPTLVAHAPVVPRSRHCRRVVLGRCGTAVWIKSPDPLLEGLALSDGYYAHQNGRECAVATVFPGGPFVPLGGDTRTRTLYAHTSNDWTSFDYDEEAGRIVLSPRFGEGLVLEL